MEMRLHGTKERFERGEQFEQADPHYIEVLAGRGRPARKRIPHPHGGKYRRVMNGLQRPGGPLGIAGRKCREVQGIRCRRSSRNDMPHRGRSLPVDEGRGADARRGLPFHGRRGRPAQVQRGMKIAIEQGRFNQGSGPCSIR